MALTDIVYPNDEQEPFIVEVGASPITTNTIADISCDIDTHCMGMMYELPKKYPIIGTNE